MNGVTRTPASAAKHEPTGTDGHGVRPLHGQEVGIVYDRRMAQQPSRVKRNKASSSRTSR